MRNDRLSGVRRERKVRLNPSRDRREQATDLDAQGSCNKESNMERYGTPHLVHLTAALPEARVLRLPDARGHRIVSLSGDVWITEQGHQEDIILRAGDAVMLRAAGMALVMAFDSADIEVVPPPAAEDPTAAWIDAAEHFEAYEQAARRLRAEAFRDAFVAVGRRIRSAGQRIAAALGAAGASRTPCTGSA